VVPPLDRHEVPAAHQPHPSPVFVKGSGPMCLQGLTPPVTSWTCECPNPQRRAPVPMARIRGYALSRQHRIGHARRRWGLAPCAYRVRPRT
jgi:hypothetical protein